MSPTKPISAGSEHMIRVQGRVLAALFLRDMRNKFGHSRFGYAWSVAEPFVIIIVLTTIFGFIGRLPLIGTSIHVFFYTGLVPLFLFVKISNAVSNSIGAHKGLYTYPMVRPIDTIIARAGLEASTVLTSALLVAIVFTFIGLEVIPDQPLALLVPILATILLATATGALNTALCIYIPSWSTIWSWLSLPTFIISGVLFVADTLPEDIRHVLSWIPLTHCVAWVRDAYYATYESNFVDVQYVWLFTLTLFAVGLLLLRAFRFKLYE